MKPWIQAVKNTVKSLETKMKDQYKRCTMRFAFVRYTDYDQPKENRVTYIDFTKLAKPMYTANAFVVHVASYVVYSCIHICTCICIPDICIWN